MKLTIEQQRAIDRVAHWLKSGDSNQFYLAGLAGTGKTTLAKYFAEQFNGSVVFAAFTGKAASVLRAKGCPNAMTIHSMIYKPSGDTHGKRVEELKKLLDNELDEPSPDNDKIRGWQSELDELSSKSRAMFEVRDDPEIVDHELVVIDECSMISEDMGRDLLSFGVPVLFLGDPGQLPPVNGKAFLQDQRPDFELTEIHRQARESPIIRLAHDIRNGVSVPFGEFGDGVEHRRKDDFDWDVVNAADQVLTGKHVTRRAINRQLRKMRGFASSRFPLPGEKLICKKNDRDDGVLNGIVCECLNEAKRYKNSISLDVMYEGERKRLLSTPEHFELHYGKQQSFPQYRAVHQFDFGYALTVHSAQGSQWRNVVVADDGMQSKNANFRRQWLYTAMTRAEAGLIWYQ